MRSTAFPAAAAAIILSLCGPARAADPSAVQAPIQGSDAMDGKNRSGPDGWSWAPQTRDATPTGSNAGNPADPNRQPNPTRTTLKPGEDPGTPVAADSHGPGSTDQAAPHKP